MSYCRWSSDNYRCDLYIYEDVSGGWTTHVAGRRHRGPIPKITADIIKQPKEFFKQYKKQGEYLDKCGLRRIRLKYAGKTFNDSTLKELLERVIELRKIGFWCPDYVIDRIKSEIGHE